MENELTAHQLEELRAALVALREQLTGTLASAKAGAGTVELDQAKVGRLSRMDSMQQQQLAKASLRNLELRLAQVKAALRRCDDGTFGDCISCEEPTAVARLRARPEAPLCLECQRSRERG